MTFNSDSKLITDELDAGVSTPSGNGDEIWNEKLRPNINKLLQLVETINERRNTLLQVYQKWSKHIRHINNFLEEARNEISKHLRNSSWTEAVGSSVSAVGSTIAVIGFALAIPTLGVSLGLTVGGTVVSVVGSTVATGASAIGGMLRKRLKKKAKHEFEIFKTCCDKLQHSCNEYTQSLNEFLQLYSVTIFPLCIKVAEIEDMTLFFKYFSGKGNYIILSPSRSIRLMQGLANKKKKRKRERQLLEQIRKLTVDDPCLNENYGRFSVTDLCLSDNEETAKCPSVEKCIKYAKTGVGLLKMGSMTPTIAARVVNMSSDMAETFAKGAAIAGRTLSITFGSISLGLDLLLVGNAFRKIYKGPVSENLEEVNALIAEVKTIQDKVLDALRLVKVVKDKSL